MGVLDVKNVFCLLKFYTWQIPQRCLIYISLWQLMHINTFKHPRVHLDTCFNTLILHNCTYLFCNYLTWLLTFNIGLKIQGRYEIFLRARFLLVFDLTENRIFVLLAWSSFCIIPQVLYEGTNSHPGVKLWSTTFLANQNKATRKCPLPFCDRSFQED